MTAGSVTSSIPSHLSLLEKCTETLTTVEGRQIDIWILHAPPSDAHISDWATAFRQQYCPDSEIDELRDGTGLSRSEYLRQLIFPDKSEAPGPSIRAGDFAELLVSDYVEYILGFWVPRGKYTEKASRNESVKGVDILGFRPATTSKPSASDTLLVFEVKAQLTGDKDKGRLQNAIDDSSKDYFRLAITLNSTKRKLLQAGKPEMALVVQRFQNLSDNRYILRSGAAAVFTDSAYNEDYLKTSTVVKNHQNANNLELVVIRGKDLMDLVHSLYERAADEA